MKRRVIPAMISFCLIGLLLAAVDPLGISAAVSNPANTAAPVPANCPVTPYSAAGLFDDFTTTWYGHDHLWAGLDRAFQGVWYAGQGVKVQWRLANPKQLKVTGKRLDATAPPLQVDLSSGYTAGFQPSGLVFPTAGCWQVTGTIPGETLRFTVFVHSAAEYPLNTSAGAATVAAANAAAEAIAAAELERPLALPSLGEGRACPRSPARQTARVSGGVLGDGPVYLQMLQADGIAYLGDSSGSATIAARWLIDPNELGPLLVRGRQLGTAATVQFGRAQTSQVVMPAVSNLRTPDWRILSWPIQIPGPGCYAIQVDGLHFTEVIVFEAAAGSPPGLAATPQP